MDHSVCMCLECKSTFKRRCDLRKHAKKFHPGKLSEIVEDKPYPFSCIHCKKFSHRKNLTMHLKNHAEDDMPTNGSKSCPICDFRGKFKCDFYNHFKAEHDINIETEKLQFSSSDEFSSWLAKIEEESLIKFIYEKGSTPTGKNYVCHRSGYYNSISTGKRHLKTQGSRKINGLCPVALEVHIDKDDCHDVTFVKTHVGHNIDVGHFSLSSDQRQTLATKVAMKIPFDSIIDETRGPDTNPSLERMHLLTKKDLYNIEASSNLHSTAQRHKNDAISIDSWVEEMKDSGVLFYKPQGTFLEDFPEFKEEDFVLIIMTEGQKMALMKFCNGCICIDGIHGLNGYDFELHTLLVLDELRQGFPCAFSISNRSDELAMHFFFNCIKKEVGSIATKVFMSDMADIYYNAWVKLMPEAIYRLFCTWHVDKAWRKNLHRVHLTDKQDAVYKTLRTLLQETDCHAFEKMMPDFINLLLTDPDTVKFAEYFRNQYMSNRKSWVQRLDKALGALMKLVKDHLFERLITLNKGKICSKFKELRKRHHISLNMEKGTITEVNDGIWQIPSTSGSYNIYTIYENKVACDCGLYCTDCKACIHKYTCDCTDCSIRWNMCKHIHLLDTHRKEKEQTSSEKVQNSGNENQLEIAENSRMLESQLILSHVSTPRSTLEKMKPLSERKKDWIERLQRVIDSVETEKQLAALETVLNPIEPKMRAIRQQLVAAPRQTKQPANKKIEQQRRPVSTIKHTKKKNRRLVKPSQEEQNSIAVNLLQINSLH